MGQECLIPNHKVMLGDWDQRGLLTYHMITTGNSDDSRGDPENSVRGGKVPHPPNENFTFQEMQHTALWT